MNRIKELRINAGYTQKEIANALGCNQTAVGKYEREDLEPNITILKTLADLFNCSIDYLVGREDDFGVINQTGNSLTSIQQELLFSFNLLDRDKQQQVIGFCKALNY